MQFINRQAELQKLDELWEKEGSQLVVIYGKRRVGKTELIKQFIKTGKGIYFLAYKRNHKEQLMELARVVGDYFEDSFLVEKGFSNWLEVFRYLSSKSSQKKFTLVIDEFPYLAETDSAIGSLFQKGWDEYLKQSNIFLILCGSSIAMMESEILSYKAPLYGRLTGILFIKPMDYIASQKFFPKKSFESFMKYYCITGGMPAYMVNFNQYENLTAALEDLCWDKQGLYRDEVNIMLRQELRTPNNYFAILKAIAWGNNRISQIANYTGLEVQLVNKYIDTLQNLHIVKREVPVTEDKPHKSKKGIYVIVENFVRFWFHYVYTFSSDLEIGNLANVKKKFSQQMVFLESLAYEQIARDYLFRNQSKFSAMEKVGRYWDKDNEIDGVGFSSSLNKIIFMEAKWSNKKVGFGLLNELKEKALSVKWSDKSRVEYYALFSKAGFEKNLIDFAQKEKNIFLVEGISLIFV